MSTLFHEMSTRFLEKATFLLPNYIQAELIRKYGSAFIIFWHVPGPLVVVDSFGATEAAIFIVLSSLVRQMDIEDSLDIFYWFKVNFL